MSDFSLIDLFRDEVKTHTATLTQGLLDLESDPGDLKKIEPLMRAAHSLKGAARIVGLDAVVALSHVMEDALVAAQHGSVTLTSGDIDVLLRSTDLLAELGEASEQQMHDWGTRHDTDLGQLRLQLEAMATGVHAPSTRSLPPSEESPPIESESVVVLGEQSATQPPLVEIQREPIAQGDEAPLFDLFREEVRRAAIQLSETLTTQPNQPEGLEKMIRAAQAIRGAARIVGLDAASSLAANLETALTALQQGKVSLDASRIEKLLLTTALFVEFIHSTPEQAQQWATVHAKELTALTVALAAMRPLPVARAAASEPPVVALTEPITQKVVLEDRSTNTDSTEAVVRVSARSLNRLMSLAGESLVQARWLQPFSTSLLKLKKHQDQLASLLDSLAQSPQEQWQELLDETRQQAALCRQVLAERSREFEDHAGQAEDLNSRLYREVIVSRMRPFADGAHGFPRLVRDMARQLNKQVRLHIDGLTTEVDRDILEKLEAPLMHLLRNAIDHGIEPPQVRRQAGKPEQGTLRIEVLHRAGMLAINVHDDGGGIDLNRLRAKVVERGLTTAEMAASMSEAELLEFLFLPGFTTSKEVTEYSGRGVGLDVVQTTIRKVGGSVRISTRPGQGTTFHLQLPITLSVVRAVLVHIAGEPYAFPHNRIDRLLRIKRSSVKSLEHRQYIHVDGQNVGLVLAAQLLDLSPEPLAGDEMPVVLLSDSSGMYGLIVESFQGEQDLVVRPLDPRLGKVPNVSAAAILDDGSPVLIADVEDMIRSMDHFIQSGTLRRYDVGLQNKRSRKRVLVVDDSVTVREVERQLLRAAGYEVDIAVDGRDGWNQARGGSYDLIVSDVDMPRLTGLELVKLLREQESTRRVPIIIVSYKDREEDRQRGLNLGANVYLTKSSFHDNRFVQVVRDLIGEA